MCVCVHIHTCVFHMRAYWCDVYALGAALCVLCNLVYRKHATGTNTWSISPRGWVISPGPNPQLEFRRWAEQQGHTHSSWTGSVRMKTRLGGSPAELQVQRGRGARLPGRAHANHTQKKGNVPVSTVERRAPENWSGAAKQGHESWGPGKAECVYLFFMYIGKNEPTRLFL